MNGALRNGVAGTLKADHEAVADQLAVARAAQDRNILDANRCGGRGGKAKRQRER